MKKKRNLIYLLILIVCTFSILFIFKNKINKYINNYKLMNKFNYTYKINSNLDVKGIIDENNIIIQDGEKLIKYNLKKSKRENVLVSVENGYNVNSVNTFENGIIWVETKDIPNISSKIYIKYYDSDNILLIDETTNKILPQLSVSDNKVVYYIADEKLFNIKMVNLESGEMNIISSYESNNSNKKYISQPNINSSSIVWSCMDTEKSIIYIYDIKTNSINELSDNELIYNPIFKGNILLGIKQNIYFDEEINDSYSSNYIVEFDIESKKWTKFKENIISNYVFEPKESIFALAYNSDLLYWTSSLRNGNYVYDFTNDIFIPIIKESYNTNTNIIFSKENIIYYEVTIEENEKLKFIYNIK
ncbi:hypothetical protein [Clostridium sartagoforme]|uniref:hypothetical protein n=1 Tax=Clostridium sartagoforme TaxID=84031 RepID=UPI0031DE0B0A